MNKKTAIIAFPVILLLAVLSLLVSCKKTEYTRDTTEDVNIVGYLDKHLDSFSLFRQILERTENSAFLNAYGNYTCFAPTNSGVQRWLTTIGAANVDAADINVLKDMVKFHILEDTISTGSFKDGKLPVPTMFGQFLITGVIFSGQSSSYIINRQATIVRSNVKVGNGILHEINNVLVPSKLTIAKQLEADPNYSIFVQALQETGFYNQLNTVDPDINKRWLTVLAESNQALADTGFADYASLKDKYSQTGNPADPKDSLHMYIAYHILPGIKFLGDIITSASHQTLEPQEVVSTQLINQEVVVNEDVFDGIVEKGVILKRSVSDNAATNGVWHSPEQHFQVKYRAPTAVYWDVCTFPEIMKLTAFYKKATFVFTRANETERPIKDIDWEFKPASANGTYFYSGATSTLTQNAVNYDVLTLPLGPPSRALWAELTTPVVIKGRYKVWICYSSQNAVTCNVRVNGELMQRPVNFGEAKPSGTDAELESIGWKQYTVSTGGGRSSGRLVGAIDIKTTERHKIRFEPLTGTNADGCRLDMIHFIPVNESQFLPRFRPDGTKVFL